MLTSSVQMLEVLCGALGYPGDRVQRIVIDVDIHSYPHIYVQFIADERLLNLNWPGHLKDGEVKIEEIGKDE